MNTPDLSVFLYLRNQGTEVENFLAEGLEMDSKRIEWVIIDDASEDNTAEVIESLLASSGNEQAFFFRHDSIKGRAVSFNEAIASSTGKCIWASTGTKRPHYKQLLQAASELISSKAGIGLNSSMSLPQSIPGWLSMLKEGVHLADDHFLLHRDVLEKYRFFFNPYLLHPLCFDLCIRSGQQCGIRPITPFLGKEHQELEMINASDAREIVFGILRHSKTTEPQKVEAFELISPVKADSQSLSEEEIKTMLFQANEFLEINELPSALNVCDRILRSQPFHEQSLILKVSILEKLKQFVEASELKHRLRQIQKQRLESEKELIKTLSEQTNVPESKQLNDSKVAGNEAIKEKKHEPKVVQSVERESSEDKFEEEEKIRTSIVISTTGSGRSALEHCLERLHHYANPKQCELIVVDNASQDDTYELLEQVEQQGFLHAQIIRNKQNMGHAASIAKALPFCHGEFALILHIDCLIEEGCIQALQQVMDDEGSILCCGPVLNEAHLSEQTDAFYSQEEVETTAEDWNQVDYLDGSCLLFRLNAGISPDEQYYPAYFEDLDLCWQAQSKKGKCAVALNAKAIHHSGFTTREMGWSMQGPEYWKNASLFAKKWNMTPSRVDIPSDKSSPLVTFAKIGEQINFWNPEAHLLAQGKELVSAEMKTQARLSNIPIDKLTPMIALAALLDERELLRTLEEKIDFEEISNTLIRFICWYYFNKKVYSRMKTYIHPGNKNQLPLDLQVLYLDMLISDREFEDAINELERLYPQYPNHPKLNHLAGELYEFGGENERAEPFFEKAELLDPMLYSKTK